MESQSKKNQVKHGKNDSIMLPKHFPSEGIIIRSYPWRQERWNPPPGIYPQNYLLSMQDLIVRGYKKQERS